MKAWHIWLRSMSGPLILVACSATLMGCPHLPVIHPKPPKPPKPPAPRGPRDPGGIPLPPSGPQAATAELRSEAERDETAKEIICFAFDTFYDSDTGVLGLPSEGEFANQVVNTLATTPNSGLSYRIKANQLYDDIEEGDLVGVAKNVGCA